MMLGMSLSTFTTVHVIISLVGIGSGFIVIFGMLSRQTAERLDRAVSVDHGTDQRDRLGFPFTHLTPGHKVGIISLVVLAIAILARYSFHMVGTWRWIYVVTAIIAAISQCLCAGGAGLREGAGAERWLPRSRSRHFWSLSWW